MKSAEEYERLALELLSAAPSQWTEPKRHRAHLALVQCYATLAVAAAYREIHGLRPFPIVTMRADDDPEE